MRLCGKFSVQNYIKQNFTSDLHSLLVNHLNQQSAMEENEV